MSLWRAGCGGTRTSGLGVRAGETDHRKVDTALRPDTHYWLADLLAAEGARVHLAHPLGNNWGTRRVKNDERDATDLVDLFQLGRLVESYIAPPELREQRELVRASPQARLLQELLQGADPRGLAKEGVAVPMTDLFGVTGTALLDTVDLGSGFAIRVESLRDLIELIDREVTMLDREIHKRLRADPRSHRGSDASRHRTSDRSDPACRDR